MLLTVGCPQLVCVSHFTVTRATLYPVQVHKQTDNIQLRAVPGGQECTKPCGFRVLGWLVQTASAAAAWQTRRCFIASSQVMICNYILHFHPGSAPFFFLFSPLFLFFFSFLIGFYSLFHPDSISLFNQILLPFSSGFYFPFQSDSTPFFIQVLFPFSIRFYSLFHPGSISLFNQILLPFSSRFYSLFIQVLLPFPSGSTALFNQVVLPFPSGSTPLLIRFYSHFNQILLPFQSGFAPFSIGFDSLLNQASLLFSGNQVSQAVHPFSIRLFSPFSQSPFYTPLYIKVVFSFSIALI